jgi:nitrate reductase NapE component
MSKKLIRTSAEPTPITTHHHTKVEVERSLDQLSHLMDGLFRIPGTGWRFGLDAVVGLIPGLGDLATTATSFYVLASGVRYRVPKITLMRMGVNIAVDYIFGSIPIVGDLFDAAWKSNQKNVQLIRERAAVSAEEARKGRLSDWLVVGLIMLLLLVLLVGSIGFSIWLLGRIYNSL